MFHLKEIKNKLRLKVAEYNKIVAFLNNLCGGIGIKVQRPDSPSVATPVEISLDLSAILHTGTPADKTGDPSNPPEATSGVIPSAGLWEWNAGGVNGLKLDCYCIVTKPGPTSNNRYMHRCRLTISRNGLVTKVEMQPEGVRVL